eukprot:CAMPEP_0114534534 /NCGR_PEP_ID=MMETSP0109-20121206/27894_1 /TAXON_ID=29199 /ORGANISM="Chlorarachnion reptans, Strain CCCM449" /LENGTH=89 /DNA_ID=CAMNT_0001717959 /DNA_START=169 /DNA_END=435 /DNA_ORIENTATION=-
MSVDEVIQAIIDEEADLSSESENSSTEDNISDIRETKKRVGKSDTRTCWNCQRKGHISRNCPDKKKNAGYKTEKKYEKKQDNGVKEEIQ